MELLAPAGGPDQFDAAMNFGADAVYLGGGSFGLRERADKFTLTQIGEAIEKAHALNRKVYVTVNALIHPRDTESLRSYLASLQELGADAFIISDLGALSIAREVAPDVALHISTQASCTNAEAAKMWHSLGAKRIVLARELTLDEIRILRSQIPDDLELEVFVHGAMCVAYSGRCLISDYLVGRDANRGNCSQPCRWSYSLQEETRAGQHFPIEEDGKATYIMSSTDMCMIEHLKELEEAGIDSVKIEGRMKGAYYVASVTNASRRVLNGEPASAYLPELETISHRPYSTGFFYGKPGQNYDGAEYSQTCDYVGMVISSEQTDKGTWRIGVDLRNRFFFEDTLEAISATHGIVADIPLLTLNHADGYPVAAADRTRNIYLFETDRPLEVGDYLRRRRETNAKNVPQKGQA